MKIGKNTFTLTRSVASLIEGINLKRDWEGEWHEGNGQKSAAVLCSDALVLFHRSCGKLICKGAVNKDLTIVPVHVWIVWRADFLFYSNSIKGEKKSKSCFC